MTNVKPDHHVPLVSVIIPNYNHAAYLEERIQSVLNQSFPDFEVIILDDCSTDNSRAIIERYQDHPKVSKVIYNEENSGSVFRQWKKGVANARGKYIWMAESDDYCEASLLQHLVNGLEAHAQCSVAYCQSNIIDMNGRITWQSRHNKLTDTIDGRAFIHHHLAMYCSIFNASMAIFRKELFSAVSEEYLTFRFSGDWFFWVEMCKLGDVFISGRTLNYFRNHTGDVTTTAVRTGQNYIEATRIIIKLYDEQLIPRKVYQRAFRKQYRQYWERRREFNGAVLENLRACFYDPQRTHLSPLMLRLDAWWKHTRNKFSKK
ncbi:glycosyltransferase family 2 protein [Chitinophaga agrisoli]|nr:glycosyltransferase family 2 protein [Chitinophaga agrisoli]